ncbi:MAG: hypothetical protein ACRDWY_10820 [Actinomycetes bacterium]
MAGSQTAAPELLPVLSRGKHRTSRKGACFMEMASVLAGERWSDHPRCTHPLLGELARHVNDCTTDANRQQLAVLIPSVVGLTSDDLRVDARIALRCAETALPVASEDRQNVMAVSVLTVDSVLAGLDGRPIGSLEERSRAALESAPRAAEWAYRFVRRAGISVRGFRRHAAPSTVRGAVHAIAEACAPDPDALLRQLLSDVIADCEALCLPDGRTAGRTEPAWREAAPPEADRSAPLARSEA